MVRRVVGESMLPALEPNKVVFAWRSKRIRPGDVVLLNHDGLEKIKRVKYVQDGKIFVAGDNPAQSTDSRNFGFIPQEVVLAKVIWPAV